MLGSEIHATLVALFSIVQYFSTYTSVVIKGTVSRRSKFPGFHQLLCDTGTVKKVARYSLTLMGTARRNMVPKNKALIEKTPNLYSIKLMV